MKPLRDTPLPGVGHEDFRAIKGAVPLKHCTVVLILLAELDFRAIKGAVPLKREVGVIAFWLPLVFPRHQRRGPIEASRFGCRWLGCPRHFRAIKGAVPLKYDGAGTGGPSHFGEFRHHQRARSH